MKNKFAERFKELRVGLGLTQTKVAEALNRHYSTIVKWERNNQQPDYDTLIEVAIYFAVTTDYLLGLEN